METYVCNVGQDDGEEQPLIVPTLHFEHAGKPDPRPRTFRRRDGNDVATDGHDDDGNTPGSPGRAPVARVTPVGVPPQMTSPGDDGTLDTDPHPEVQDRTQTPARRSRPPLDPIAAAMFTPTDTGLGAQVTCPDCGHTFTPEAEKPLILPTMNFKVSKSKRGRTAVQGDMATRVDTGSNPNSDEYLCPRCGAKVE